jgi:protein ImuB
MSGRRYLALHLPYLATDRLARAMPELREKRLAIWQPQDNRNLLVAVNELAARDLAPGLKLAEASAMVPDLVTLPADPAADAALLKKLARWATRYTPLVAIDGADALVLDIFGCTHPFGSEAALLKDAAERLARMGFAVRAAVAGTAAASLALARAGRHAVVVSPGEEFAATAALPLASLGLDGDLLARLEKFGIRDVGGLAAQPRAALSRRVGPAALAALDVALGVLPAPIAPLPAPKNFSASLDFAEPILTAEAIAAALDRLLETLCAQLAQAGQGVRRVTLACLRADGAVQRIGIGTSLAVREPAHLKRLFHDRLERIDPGFGIDRMVLAADAVEALGVAQSAFDDDRALRSARRVELAALVDRLRGRLGAPAVHRLASRPTHIPERAVEPVNALPPLPSGEGRGEGRTPPPPARPVRLFVPPEPVSVVSLLPDGPPRRVRWGNHVIGVARAEGPERISPEWWREPDAPTRDYWRVEAEEGGRFWLYRDQPARWFLHGLFG